MALEVARNRRGTTIAGGDVNGGGEMPHLRIITRDYLNETRYRTRLGDFLDELFEGMSPLRVANMERSTYQGRTVVLVKLSLNDQNQLARRANAFVVAVTELCSAIVARKNRDLLTQVTPRGILGFSPVEPLFKHHWNWALFSRVLRDGPPLLQEIHQAFNDDYLPTWAMVLSFAALSENIFPDFQASFEQAMSQLQSLGPELPLLGSIALLILDRIMELYKGPNKQQLSVFENNMIEYKANIDLVIRTSARLRQVRMNPTSAESAEDVEYDLFDALYVATEQAAKVTLSNKEIWGVYKNALNINAVQEAGNIIGMGLGGMACAGAITTVETITVAAAPLSSWSLGSYAGFIFYGQTPMVATAATSMTIFPPLAIAGVVVAAVHATFFIKHRLEERQLKKRIVYHGEVDALIKAAWKVTYFTSLLLHLVNNTGGGTPTEVGFVNEEARARWCEFVAYVRQVGRGQISTRDSSPQAVLLFVNEQREILSRLRRRLDEAERNLKS